MKTIRPIPNSAIFFGVVLTVISLLFWSHHQHVKESKMQAWYIIGKVEEYKKIHHKLPDFFDDMHLGLQQGEPVSYWKENQSDYTVSFDINPLNFMTYHSVSRRWEEGSIAE